MAITLVGAKSIAYGTSQNISRTVTLSDLTGGIDTAPAAGDIVIGVSAIGSAVTRNTNFTTSGYNKIIQESQFNTATTGNNSAGGNLAVGYKVMGASPDADISFVTGSTGATTDGFVLIVAVYRGVDQSNPISIYNTNKSLGTRIPDSPAVVPTRKGSGILSIGVSAGYSNLRGFSAAPSSYQDLISFSDDDFLNVESAIALKPSWLSGTEDPGPFTMTSADTITGVQLSSTIVLNAQLTKNSKFIPFFM